VFKTFSKIFDVFLSFGTIIHAENVKIVLINSLRKLRNKDKHFIALFTFKFKYIQILLNQFIKSEITISQLIYLFLEIIQFYLVFQVRK